MKHIRRFLAFAFLAIAMFSPNLLRAQTFGAAANFPAGTFPNATITGDFNNDGDEDIAVANSSSNNVSVLLGNGSGGFPTTTTVTVGSTPSSLAAGFFNGDSNLDLAVTSNFGGSIAILLGNGSGNFTTDSTMVVGPPTFIAVRAADFNNDGETDLIATVGGTSPGGKIVLLTGNGNGKFVRTDLITGLSSPKAIAVGNFDAGGNVDIAFITSSQVSIYTGNGAGGFTPASGSPYAISGSGLNQIITGNFSADGNLDLAITQTSTNSAVQFLNGNGSGQFSPGTPIILNAFATDPQELTAADFNLDGALDLSVSCKSSVNRVVVFRGSPAGIFTFVDTLGAGTTPFGNAVADFNNDALPDIVASNNTTIGTVSVFLNTTLLLPAITVTTTNDNGPGSLRQAIADLAPGGIITFNPALARQTITLTGGEFLLAKNIDVRGPKGGITISGNNASRIFNVSAGNLRLEKLTLQNGSGGGGDGGAIFGASTGVLALQECTFKNNLAVYGGAIRGNFAAFIADRCTFANNSAAFSGAISFFVPLAASLTNCTFTGNTSNDVGGAVGLADAGTNATFVNCTISGNDGGVATGGGIYSAGLLTLVNTIVAGNTGSPANVDFVGSTFGAINSLFGPGSTTPNGTNVNNLFGAVADLGPFQDNGGLTQTMALLPTSPAIDAGTNAGAPDTDQRGNARTIDGNNDGTATADIGAYEAPPQTSWNAVILPGNPSTTFNAAAASNSVFIVAGDSGNIYTSPNGVTWTLLAPDYTGLGFAAPPNLKGIAVDTAFATLAAKGHGTQGTNGFGSAVAVGVGGTILRSADGGTSWSSVAPSGATNDLNAVASSSTFGNFARKGQSTQGTNGFGSAVAVGVGGTILRSADDGQSWSSASSSTTNTLQGIALSDDFPNVAAKGNGATGTQGFGSAVAVGVGGTILRSTDGANWSVVASGTSNDLNAVAIVNDGTSGKGQSTQGVNGFGSAVAVGVGGTILRSLDGTTWTDVSANLTGGSPLLLSLQSVVGLNATTWFVSGDGGAVYKTTDFGDTWQNLSTPGGVSLNAVAFQPNGNGIIAGSGATVYASSTGGTLWTSEGGLSAKPQAFALRQNYPNPFNPSTVISYQLSMNSGVSLKVFDVLGREVATLVGARQAVGNYTVNFNAAKLSSGIYFYRLVAGNFVQTKKMLLLK